MAQDPMAEIHASFFVECEELLERLQDALTAIEAGDHDPETINVVFRAVHSIKGGAGAFALLPLVAFAHRFETVLDALRSGQMQPSPEAIKRFFQAADLMQDHVRAARDGTAGPANADEVLQALEALAGAPAEMPLAEVAEFQPLALVLDLDADPGIADSAEPQTAWQVFFAPHAALYATGNEPLHLLRALSALGTVETRCAYSAAPDLIDLDPEAAWLAWQITLAGKVGVDDIREVFDFVEGVCALEIGPAGGTNACTPGAQTETAQPRPAALHLPAAEATPAHASGPPPQPTLAAKAAESATVRVDLERIDRLVNLVGELVINQAMLAQSVAEAGLAPSSAVANGLEAFMMLTRDLQDSVMMIRAQPVKPLFQRMARIVREASAAIGKEVRLHPEGEATEVDKTVIERLADPLTHMVRNAVDHGLETPEARQRAGKPREGLVTLRAMHRAGRVLIEVEDDGAGINRAKVREIAISRGLIAADAVLSNAEIDALLFLPGFSTATTVSALSGRGVGMDVVRQAIQSLGGRVTITSDPGLGSKFSISLPLTLAVLDGMVVQVAGQKLVVPLSSILETAALTQDDIRALGPQTHVISVRGAIVPLYDLGTELGFRQPRSSYDGSIVLFCVLDNGTSAALAVDAILEQRQVVIKGLQKAYGHIPGVAAATILGDGQIALILDPADLVRSATGHTRTFALALAG
ncbi:chemotaxis protein CheA [Phaeovulum sp.]|uniref:chemotaxis protein CheA n=1 Tax=Phaeovulum sp. TaxID=2934796 RepID=UPI002730C4A9|nr:chemotaxis protein CheA [Phaeovulum sp.]MDP1667634.1 chemotaxis protein CheA [Phaeovulum sp.]MDZ4118475.1 chemotaxis protein CheA [Phaeovulum sp.]